MTWSIANQSRFGEIVFGHYAIKHNGQEIAWHTNPGELLAYADRLNEKDENHVQD